MHQSVTLEKMGIAFFPYFNDFISSDRECNETDIILSNNGYTFREGRVQVCLDGAWASVCYDKWDYRDAKVVCRQLGFDGREFKLTKIFQQ